MYALMPADLGQFIVCFSSLYAFGNDGYIQGMSVHAMHYSTVTILYPTILCRVWRRFCSLTGNLKTSISYPTVKRTFSQPP